MHLKILCFIISKLLLKRKLLIFVLIMPYYSTFDRMRGRQDRIQSMLVNAQIHITEKLRATFTVIFLQLTFSHR